jgi:hypothetical protein
MAYARRSNYVDYSRRSVRYKLIDPRVNPIQEANPKFHASIIAYLPERRIWLKITNSGRDARRHPFVEEVSDYRRGSGTFLVGVGEEIPYDYALSDRWQLNALTD